MGLLLGNLRGQMAELIEGPMHLVPRLLAITAVHQRGGAGQPAASPAGDRRHHLQIAQQLGRGGALWARRRSLLYLPLRFQKHLRLSQNPLPHRG
jgi:hypothetical protein